MDIFRKQQNRNDYFETQINRSKEKYGYCKVSINHGIKFRNIISKYNLKTDSIVCMGTRNGREIDIFRTVFHSNPLLIFINKLLEVRRRGYTSTFSFYNKRSDIKLINESNGVYGVEINPEAQRQDTFIGSFDELPKNWEKSIDILYSNSFDQSQDPFKTAMEWKRIVKSKGIIILGFTYTEPTIDDPVGNLNLIDLLKLFDGEVIYYEKDSSTYNDVIIQLN